MEQEKKMKLVYLTLSAVMVLLGLYMVIRPVNSAEIICTAIGIAILVLSILGIIRYITTQVKSARHQVLFAVCVAAAVIGIILLFRPGWILALIHIFIGIGILIDGIFKLVKALEAKSFAREKWWLILIFAILTCLLGLILIFNPFSGVSITMTIIGVILIVEGAQNFWIGLYAVRS